MLKERPKASTKNYNFLWYQFAKVSLPLLKFYVLMKPSKTKKNWGVSHLPWANSVSRLKHYTILKEPFKTWMHIITQYFSWEITANHSMAHLIVLNFFYAVVSHIFVLRLMIDLVKHVVSMCKRIKQRSFTKFRNPHVVSTS